MNQIFKSILRPIDNRNYTSEKTSAVLYAVRFFPVVLACIFGAIFIDHIFVFVLLGAIIYGVIDYVLFDAFLDKMTWGLLWRRHYGNETEPLSSEQEIIKRFEQDPSPENRKALDSLLKK